MNRFIILIFFLHMQKNGDKPLKKCILSLTDFFVVDIVKRLSQFVNIRT